MNVDIYLLAACFFFIALLYSSVGFGGGSLYLALLALSGLGIETIRPAALICNIIVVAGGTWVFYRERQIDLKRSAIIIVASFPLAFLGALWRLEDSVFFLLLGSTLIVASVLLWSDADSRNARPSSKTGVGISALAGGSIGFLSGLVGIGGGIFLSPLLHFLRWDQPRRIAALASFFILVNSISGLTGYALKGHLPSLSFLMPLALAVIAGGQIGSRLGARKFDQQLIKKITAVVIFIAGLFILRQHL
ncbi:MAG TPA: sulfite exporter TauE/SafE family protein [Chryseosolibacter sp.]|nr:sulfite exporter TauE/SafE family protein [Chryseosolibacter sp.]